LQRVFKHAFTVKPLGGTRTADIGMTPPCSRPRRRRGSRGRRRTFSSPAGLASRAPCACQAPAPLAPWCSGTSCIWKQRLKPVFHLIGSGIAIRRFQAAGRATACRLYRPPTMATKASPDGYRASGPSSPAWRRFFASFFRCLASSSVSRAAPPLLGALHVRPGDRLLRLRRGLHARDLQRLVAVHRLDVAAVQVGFEIKL
jgi:hypothetical protein